MVMIKTIAMYLPQYHKIVENDNWWGQGFTDWVAVKKAIPLFDGHFQPRHPLGEEYYDLLNKNVMKWQCELARRYNVYGFSFYHYWFKDGRRILEKPVENFLRWKDINMPFCFTWANETWARSWSNIENRNSWADVFEDKPINSTSQILLEQKYGLEEDWKKHFNYLLPFFKDQRYIKIKNKPVFIFYRPDIIPCLSRMVRFWHKLAKESGLSGIYFMGMNSMAENMEFLDALIIHEPGFTMQYDSDLGKEMKKKVQTYQYNKIWESIIAREYSSKKKIYFGGFVGYDDTPRRGYKGTVILEQNEKDFKKYYDQLVYKSMQNKNEFLFLNAWNEWGEGMYLEPDDKTQFNYLEAIYEVTQKYNGANKKLKEKIPVEGSKKSKPVENSKYEQYYKLIHHWLLLKEADKSILAVLLRYNCKTIAIYGMGELANHLICELNGTSIHISYIVDRDDVHKNTAFPLLTLNDYLPKVDAIIVTPIYDFYKIEKILLDLVDFPIISLEEIIFEG